MSIFGPGVLFNGGNRGRWKEFLASLRREGDYGIFLMIGEATPFHFDELQPLFKEAGVPVFGGIFPGIVYESSWQKKGVLGCSIERPVFVQPVKDLGGFAGLSQSVPEVDSACTFLVIVDGLAPNTSSFLEVLFETCSKQASYIGGGAGSISLVQRPVLFTEDDYFANGALLVGIEGFVGVGVSHGWEPIYGPLVANQAQGNVMVELHWQTAFSCYRQILEKKVGIKVEPESFFDVAKSYPFGMVKMDGSIVVRDPIRVGTEGGIVLVGEVPENSVVMILRGDPENLIMAAGEAAEQAVTRFREQNGNLGQGALVIDCISRVLYLGDGIARELEVIRGKIPPDLRMFGFLSLGEVASIGDRYLEFYNKTTVVGVG